jgi:spore coat protein U-like protein
MLGPTKGRKLSQAKPGPVCVACWCRGVAVLAALAAMPGTPDAQTYSATGLLPVTIEIAASCVVSSSDLDFGRYLASAASVGQTFIQLQCTSGVTVEVGLDAGQAPGATPSNRRLVSGADSLRYGLFQDPARRINWGITPSVDTVEVQTTGAPQTVPIYGQIPAGQQVPPGTYGDVITIYLNY